MHTHGSQYGIGDPEPEPSCEDTCSQCGEAISDREYEAVASCDNYFGEKLYFFKHKDCKKEGN